MRIKRIISTLLHPTTIKTVGLLVILGTSFFLHAYADSAVDAQTLQKTKDFLQTFLSLFSRLRVILAIIAGKLMTNDFVYGAFLHMDIYLRKIRNIMKNFANFALVWLVLISIVKGLIGKEALDVKKVITNTLLAGILIQSSRFLMGAFIDLSSVATAAIGGFPSAFLSNDAVMQEKMNTALDKVQKKKIVVDPNATTLTWAVQLIVDNWAVDEHAWDKFLPTANSVSGPFIYLWSAVFSFQSYLNLGDTKDPSQLTLWFALRLFFLFFFTMGLLLLLIANVIRIGLLRIFIIGSPFLILFQVFDKKLWEWWWGLGKIFTLGNLISTAFKPVIFVTGVSLMLIVIVSMQNTITWSWATRENNLNGVTLSTQGTENSSLAIQDISTVTLVQKDILWKDVLESGQNFFSHLIMLLLSIFIMRRFIKLSLTLGGGTISEIMKVLIEDTEGFAKSMPIIPGWFSVGGVKKLMEKERNMTLWWFGLNEKGEFGTWDAKTKRLTTNAESVDNRVQTSILWELPNWGDKDTATVKKALERDSNGIAFFDTSKQIAQNVAWWISLTTTGRTENLRKLLNNPTSTTTNTYWFTGPLASANPTEAQLKTYFDNGWWKNAKALWKAMWWAVSKVREPSSYDELKNAVFYPNRT